MKIDGAAPASTHTHPSHSRATNTDSFERILDEKSKRRSVGNDPAMYAAPLRPSIGDNAISFSEKPIVLLTSVELAQTDDIYDHAKAWLETASKAETLEPTALRQQDIAQLYSGHISAAKDQADANRITVPAASENMGKPQPIAAGHSTKNLAPITPSPSLASQQSTGIAASSTQKADGVPQTSSRTEVPALSRQTERSGSRPTVFANLFAVDNGLRLVVRTPVLEAKEHLHLLERLKELFAAYGYAQPEIIISQPLSRNKDFNR